MDRTASPATELEDLPGVRDAYLAAVPAPNARGARVPIDETLDAGVPAERIYLDVLQSALHEVGRLWEQARIAVANEHLATPITAAVLARPFIVAGGQAFAGDRRRARAVGADAYAGDPATVLELAAERFGTHARRTG